MPAPVLQFKRGNAGVAGTVPALRPGEPAISLNNFDFFIGIDTSVANNKFFGSHRYWGREDGTNSLRLKLVDKDGTNSINLKAPNTLAGVTTYTFPATPTADYFLKTGADGTLSWAQVSQSSFSGIVTFTDTTDNTLGNADTGSVQIDGGVGIAKNLTVGAGLSVAGQSYFIGTATFYGGQINLGDSDTDDIVVAGEFKSNLIPSDDATYNLGTSAKRWNNASFAGIGTFATGLVADGVQIGISGANVIDTVSGNLTLNSAGGSTIIDDAVTIQNNLTVNGNVTVGGTTVTLRGQDVYIENKDIILGYTTSITPNDTTANHAGVAIASTEGTPLVSFAPSGINTLPDTYKQLMWFQSGTLGFATDAFAFNYGLAIGTTTMGNGVRLAVGSGITMSDTGISATNFYGALSGNATSASSADQVKTVTASNTNATYHITFVDANNGSATSENVYTDDGIYYNPGTNTFTTQYGYFTGNITVDGTITGTATTATRATTVDTTGTSTNADYYVTFVDTLAGQTGETLRVGAGLSVNPSTGDVKTTGRLSVGNPGALTSYIKAGGGSDALYLYANGDVAFQQKVIVGGLRSSSNSNNTLILNDLDATFAGNLAITGITTIGTGVGITQFSSAVGSGTSTSSVPTSSAVIDYVGSQVSGIDLTTSIAGDTGTGSVSTSQTLTIAGTAGEIETSASSQTITVGLPDTVIVGTALSTPTLKTATVQHQNGTQAATIDTSGNITASQNLTVSGNLYVNGSTTQVNTAAITVEDRTIELGVVNGSAPSASTTWDLGVLFNYYDGSAKKSAVVWEHGDQRFKLASLLASDTDGTNNSTPQLTVTTFAPIEVSELWINNSCTGGASQVIACSGAELVLQNITVDAGTF